MNQGKGGKPTNDPTIRGIDFPVLVVRAVDRMMRWVRDRACHKTSMDYVRHSRILVRIVKITH